jgi:hypothetical protein
MCELQTLNSSLALLCNVSHNVCDSISLVLEMAIGHIVEA